MGGKKFSLELHERCLPKIRALLVESWDPAGVKGEAEFEDEYDNYVSGVIGILINGGNAKAVAWYMVEVDREMFEYHSEASSFEKFAKEAVEVYVSERSKMIAGTTGDHE